MADFDRPGGSAPAAVRPTEPQRRYLERGLSEPGGKLPLFDRDGRQVPRKTVEACIAHGWAEPWTANPIKPDWLVCRLTSAGYEALGAAPAGARDGGNKANVKRSFTTAWFARPRRVTAATVLPGFGRFAVKLGP